MKLKHTFVVKQTVYPKGKKKKWVWGAEEEGDD